MSGGTASSVQSPQGFQAPYQGATAGNVLAGIPGLSNFNMSNPNAYAKLVKGFEHSPYASMFQQGAGTAGQLGQQQALGQYGVGQQLTGLGLNQLAPYAGTVMNTAMDPQQALYQRSLGQMTDTANAQLAQSGVGTTPYGQGVMGQDISNFNIDWQNNQLQRQLAGLQGAGGALGQAGQLAGMGQGLAGGAPGQYLQGAGMPFGAAQNIFGAQTGAYGGQQQYGMNNAQLGQQQIQDYMNYLGWGTGQQNANTGLFNAQLGQNQQQWNQLGSLGSGIGSMFGAGGMFGQGMGGGAFAGFNPFQTYGSGYGGGTGGLY